MFCQNLWKRMLPIAAFLFVSIVGRSAFAQETEPKIEFLDVEIEDDPDRLLVTKFDTLQFAQERFWTGVHLSPVDAALRAQLDLAETEGVVVAEVESGSPAEEAGIQPHDVLLTIDGEAVTDTDTYMERILEAGEKAATILLLRGGKRLSLEINPRHREWDVLTYLVTEQYRIGVSLADVDESLRSQLGLPDGQGLVVTDVHEDSPAAEAGIELHDILLEFGGKPLTTVEDFTSQIQEVGDRPATLELTRRGERQSIRVTPELQLNEQANFSLIEADVLGFEVYQFENATGQFVAELTFDIQEEETIEQQLEQLIQEMEALTERMETLQQSIQEPQEADAAADGGGAGDEPAAGAEAE